MLSSPTLNFIIITTIILILVVRYGRPGIDGITKKRMRMPGHVSWNWRKWYEIEGEPAFLMGCFLVISCIILILIWIRFAMAQFPMR